MVEKYIMRYLREGRRRMESMMDIEDYIKNEIKYWSRCKAFKKCSYGDKNEGKKFRVLCNKDRMAGKQGLLSTVSLILPNIIEARRHGYIPVIDLCRNSRWQPLLQEQGLMKKENAWEYYFTQPNREISLEEVRCSKYVEEQVGNCCGTYYYIGDKCLEEGLKLQHMRRAIRQNIHLQPDIKKRVMHEKHVLFPKTQKILGVGIRTGYRAGIVKNLPLYNGHPIVGSCADYITDIERKLSEWKYDSFFLAIDDRSYLEEIKKYFGESCIYLEKPRIHYFRDAMLDIPTIETEEAFVEVNKISVRKKNEDYLVELYLLAQCDGLYASRGTGYNFSYLLNNGRYSYVEFEDLGEFKYAK